MKDAVGDESFTGKNILPPNALLLRKTIEGESSSSLSVNVDNHNQLETSSGGTEQGILYVPPATTGNNDPTPRVLASDATAPPPPLGNSEGSALKTSDLRQDLMSRGVWKKTKKPDIASTLAQTLKESMQTVLSFTAQPAVNQSALVGVVKYLQTSQFAQNKPQLWKIIKTIKEDSSHSDIILSLSDELKDEYIESNILSN
jgi:hypothetical protein